MDDRKKNQPVTPGLEERLNRLRSHPGIAAVLEAATGPVWLVGGGLRDLLLDKPVHDYDLVAPGDLEATARRAAKRLGTRPVPLGRGPFRVFRLPVQEAFVDVCPLAGTDLAADLARRDLTINAMAVRLDGRGPAQFLDPAGGLEDLARGTVRFVAETNVLADPLRLLRLFRFAAGLGFHPDPASLELVRRHAALINQAAGERIREELLHLFSASCRVAVGHMSETGLLAALVPEIRPLAGCGQGDPHHLDVLGHTLAALAAAEEVMAAPGDFLPEYAGRIEGYLAEADRPALLKLTLLLHDLGKPGTRTEDGEGRVRFYGHAGAGAELAARVCARWRFSNEETGLVTRLIRLHLRPFHLMEAWVAGTLTKRGVFRFGRDAGGDLWGLVVHALADMSATLGPAQLEKAGRPALVRFLGFLLGELLRQQRTVAESPPLLTGRDLLSAFSLEPSPLIGRLLAEVEEARACGRVQTREEALALAAAILRGDEKPPPRAARN
ncbi:MAG: HD domain-containing protein [Thermodesulfobacteriota bacterium]